MPAPWEKYQQATTAPSAPAGAGPWAKYQQATPAAAPAANEPSLAQALTPGQPVQINSGPEYDALPLDTPYYDPARRLRIKSAIKSVRDATPEEPTQFDENGEAMVAVPAPPWEADEPIEQLSVYGSRSDAPPLQEDSWGDVMEGTKLQIGAKLHSKEIGAREQAAEYQAMQAHKRMWQAIVLPDAIRRHFANKASAKPGEKFESAWDDPMVTETAKRLGLQTVDFVKDWPAFENMSDAEAEQIRREATEDYNSASAALEELGHRRNMMSQVMRPRVTDQERGEIMAKVQAGELSQQQADEMMMGGLPTVGSWTKKGLVMDALPSFALDMVPAGIAGYFGGPAAAMATMGATVQPESYTGLRQEGVAPGKAFMGSGAHTLLEVAPETKVFEQLFEKTPAGKAVKKALVKRFLGHTGSAALKEMPSEMTTELGQILVNAGLLDLPAPTLAQGAEQVARAGAIGAVSTGPLGAIPAVREHRAYNKREAEASKLVEAVRTVTGEEPHAELVQAIHEALDVQSPTAPATMPPPASTGSPAPASGPTRIAPSSPTQETAAAAPVSQPAPPSSPPAQPQVAQAPAAPPVAAAPAVPTPPPAPQPEAESQGARAGGATVSPAPSAAAVTPPSAVRQEPAGTPAAPPVVAPAPAPASQPPVAKPATAPKRGKKKSAPVASEEDVPDPEMEPPTPEEIARTEAGDRWVESVKKSMTPQQQEAHMQRFPKDVAQIPTTFPRAGLEGKAGSKERLQQIEDLKQQIASDEKAYARIRAQGLAAMNHYDVSIGYRDYNSQDPSATARKALDSSLKTYHERIGWKRGLLTQAQLQEAEAGTQPAKPAKGKRTKKSGDMTLAEREGIPESESGSVESDTPTDADGITVEEEELTDEQVAELFGQQAARTMGRAAPQTPEQSGREADGGTRTDRPEGRGGGGTQAGAGGARPPGVRRVYRGSQRGTTQLTPQHFETASLGRATGHASSGLGVFFTSDPADAGSYGQVAEHDIQLDNPKTIPSSQMPSDLASLDEYIKFREKLEAQGYDGIVIDFSDIGEDREQYVAFRHPQVLSGKRYTPTAEEAAENAEPEEFDLSAEFEADDLGDLGEITLEDRGKKQTKAPVAPNDPLAKEAARRAAAIRAAEERRRIPPVAPKRDMDLGRSRFDKMWQDLAPTPNPGESPADYDQRREDFIQRMRNAPTKVQMRYTQRRLKQHFAFKDITVDPQLQDREALDAMHDAYNNLHRMAGIMGLPRQAMGFNGQLTMNLAKSLGGKGTRGSFSVNLGKRFMDTATLSLARRADSFTHEWLHALDFNLMMRYAKTFAEGTSGLSDFARNPLKKLPREIAKPFNELMRALFLDNEQAVTRMATVSLNAETAAEQLKRAKEAKNQAEIDRWSKELANANEDMKKLLTSQASALHQGSAYVDQLAGDRYFAIPAEILARAGESWMANRVGTQTGVEFLTGDKKFYNEQTDRLMSLVYPNEADRTRIFEAFDGLFSALSTEEYFKGDQVEPQMPLGAAPSRMDKELKAVAAQDARVGAIRSALNKWVIDDVKKIGSLFRKGGAAKAGAIGKDIGAEHVEVAKALIHKFYTARGRMLGLVSKFEGHKRLQQLVQDLTDQLTTDPGSGRVQGVTMEREYTQRAQANLNRLYRIVDGFGLDVSNETQMAQLFEELAKPSEQVRAELQDYIEFLEQQIADNVGDRNKVGAVRNWRIQLDKTQTQLAAIGKPSKAPQNVRDAADSIREMLDEEYYANQEAGIDLGYVSNHVRRVMDDKSIKADTEGFVRQATEVYEFEKRRNARALQRQIAELQDKRAVEKSKKRNLEKGDTAPIDAKIAELQQELREWQSLDAKQEATNWLYSSQVSDMFQTDRNTPPSNYTKRRKLGPIADLLMKDYYNQNPIDSLTQYFPMSARRIAYARRFGHDNSKYEAIRNDIISELQKAGFGIEDIEVIDEQVKIAAGTYTSNISKESRLVLDYVYNTGTMALLPASLFAQLAEPMTAGLRTGNVNDAFRNMAYTMQQVFATGDAAQMREIADIIGIMSRAGNDSITASHLQYELTDQRSRRYADRFQKAIGVHGYTNASRIASMKLGGKYILSTAELLLTGNEKQKAVAADEFNELGIPPEEHETFAKYVQSTGSMISVNQLNSPENSKLKQQYIHALHGFVDGVIGNVKATDRARLAHHPVGRFITSLMSFNYYFQRHVLARMGKNIWRAGTADSKAGRVAQRAAATAQFMLPLAALIIGQYAARLLREGLLDRDRFQKRIENLDSWQTLTDAIDAAGITGAFTPLYNWLFPSRFKKSAASLAMGSVAGFYLDSLNDIHGAYTDEYDPNDTSNAAERKATRAGYRLVVNTLVPRILGHLGLGGTLGWLAVTNTMSWQRAQQFAELTVPKTPNELAHEAEVEKSKHRTPMQKAIAERRRNKRQENIERRYGQ